MNPTTLPTRRRFLGRAAATAAAPFLLPSRIWSADTAPSDRLQLGFIGMGKMNSGHLRSFLGRPEVQVRAVCDVDTTRRDNAQKTVHEAYQNTDCAAYNAFEDLLARDDIDAVVIATPDHWHAFVAIAALKAGKDVYCEKPLTHNIHEAKTLIQAVKDSGKILQTGSQQRSSKEFRVACELVRNGLIGKVQKVDCSFGDPAGPYALGEEAMEPGLDWDRWCGPGPLKPYNSILSPRGVHNHFPAWRMTREFGGGMITDWGAHHIDIAQ
ncbi:MAG: Gfo/Idh/MocA family oxidoreductase, partial [Verrucomicrobiales bacterium]|nr:Gfo/Idh/MocA family oxidoreductase [Verrucomicrobiales bacterium]